MINTMKEKFCYEKNCTAIRNLVHCLNQDWGTITFSLKGVSDGQTQKIHTRLSYRSPTGNVRTWR